MADEADMTQARIEAEDAMRAKQTPAPALPPATGRCLYCDEPTVVIEIGQTLPDYTPHFCSTECRQDWQRENKIRRAQGLA